MDEHVIEGTWWLPATRQRKVPGSLVAEPSRFRLVAYDALKGYCAPDAVDGIVNHQVGGPSVVTIPVIHGYMRDKKAVTLLNASGIDMSGPFETVTEPYDVEVALIGGHITQNNFAKITVYFDWLDSWLSPPSIVGDDPRRWDLSVIEDGPVELYRFQPEGATVTIKVGVIGSHDRTAIHLDRAVSVTIEPREASDWQDLLNRWVRPLQDFLTITIGRTVQMTSVHLWPTLPDPFHNTALEARFRTIQPISLHYGVDGSLNATFDVHSYTAPILATGRAIQDDLTMILTHWMNEWPTRSGIVALLVSHLYAPFMFTAQRYASIFQAIEGLHQVLHPARERTRAEHRARVAGLILAAEEKKLPADDVEWARRILTSRNDKSLTQRIDEMIDDAGPLGVAIREATPHFASTSATLRGSVAHPQTKEDERQPNASAQYWYGEVLSWLGRATLLHLSGLPDAFGRASRNAALRYALGEVAKIAAEPPKLDK